MIRTTFAAAFRESAMQNVAIDLMFVVVVVIVIVVVGLVAVVVVVVVVVVVAVVGCSLSWSARAGTCHWL